MEDDWVWSFLEPWCRFPAYRLRYVTGLMEDARGQSYRGIQVQLPSPPEPDDEDYDQAEFETSMKELRESLGLLAAVAHVDNAAWKRLLVDHAKLEIKSQEELFEEEFMPRFQLALVSDPDTDGDLLNGIEAFCNTKQHFAASVEYKEALSRVAALAGGKHSAGSTEIEVPVTIQLGPWITESTDKMMEYLRDLQKRVRSIRMQWQNYFERSGAPLSVTFVLEDILLDLRDVRLSAEIAELMESFAHDGIRFSGLTLRQELHQSLAFNGGLTAARETVGRYAWGLFGGTKRREGEYDFEATTMTGPLAATYGHANQLSLKSLHFDCEAMRHWVFERMCSAVAVNQTTTRLSLELEMDDGDDSDDGDWELCRWRWQWITFACFSEKARLHSCLKNLSLRNAIITDEAVEAMAEVLATDGPEEALLGCTTLPSDASVDISVKANSPIRLQPMYFNEAYATTFRVARDIVGVRLLSEPDDSGLLDVLIPGFGKCQVQQSSLRHRAVELPSNGLAGVTTLSIKFGEDPHPKTLQALLTLIGASLMHLTLEFESFNTCELAGIVASCPKLIELAICTPSLEMRFCLRDGNYRDLALHDAMHLSLNDVGGIAKALADPESPLTMCARRLRVRMGHTASGYMSNDWFRKLLRMLEMNTALEYLDIVTGRPYMVHFNEFKAHHLESLPVVESPVGVDCKAAFLSVMGSQYDEVVGYKKRKHQTPLPVLNQHALENIFEFAAAHVTRRVYFREHNFFETGRNYLSI